MEIKRRHRLRRMAALVLVALPMVTQAQDELRLTIRKDFGFRAGSIIQGRFTLGVDGPTDLVRVIFEIDGRQMAEIAEPPFQHRFNTSEYDLGPHTLAAVGFTGAGDGLRSPARAFEFVSAEAGWEAAGSLAIPLVAAIIVLMAAGTLAPVVLGRKRVHKPGEYGSAGGAVCPRCEFPYARSFFSPNLLVGKLARCPHCGKWAVVRRASETELDRAEAQLLAENVTERPELVSEDERLRKMVEASRFEE